MLIKRKYGRMHFENKMNHMLHRTNGPFIKLSKFWEWWLHGERHRYYGPVDSTGDWSIHGEYLDK